MNNPTNGSPSLKDLARAVRAHADSLHDRAYLLQEEIPEDLYRLARDAAELGRVLARVIEGKPIDRAMGAPGDWGYSHPIGKALAAMYASAVAGVVAGRGPSSIPPDRREDGTDGHPLPAAKVQAYADTNGLPPAGVGEGRHQTFSGKDADGAG